MGESCSEATLGSMSRRAIQSTRVLEYCAILDDYSNVENVFHEWALEYVPYMCEADGKKILKVMNLPCPKLKQIKITIKSLTICWMAGKSIGHRTEDWQRLKDDGTTHPPRKSTAK